MRSGSCITASRENSSVFGCTVTSVDGGEGLQWAEGWTYWQPSGVEECRAGESLTVVPPPWSVTRSPHSILVFKFKVKFELFS